MTLAVLVVITIREPAAEIELVRTLTRKSTA